MRDHGLEEAIRAAGGVSELARQLGISQPSVSNWTRIPAERVVAVESLTNVPRTCAAARSLRRAGRRPGNSTKSRPRARANTRCSRRFCRARRMPSCCRGLSNLRGDATPLGVAHVDLAEAASRVDVATVEREFFNLFIGVGRSELLPYASYYLTGFLHERPLARLREDLAAFGIERREGQAEPEDHAGILCEIMAGLIDGRLPAPAGTDQKIFEKHWRPGSAVSSPISSAAKARTFTGGWERSAGCSLKSKQRPSRSRRNGARKVKRRNWRIRRCIRTKDKTGTSRFPSRAWRGRRRRGDGIRPARRRPPRRTPRTTMRSARPATSQIPNK